MFFTLIWRLLIELQGGDIRKLTGTGDVCRFNYIFKITEENIDAREHSIEELQENRSYSVSNRCCVLLSWWRMMHPYRTRIVQEVLKEIILKKLIHH